jgi:hypothetical protein
VIRFDDGWIERVATLVNKLSRGGGWLKNGVHGSIDCECTDCVAVGGIVPIVTCGVCKKFAAGALGILLLITPCDGVISSQHTQNPCVTQLAEAAPTNHRPHTRAEWQHVRIIDRSHHPCLLGCPSYRLQQPRPERAIFRPNGEQYAAGSDCRQSLPISTTELFR